MYHNIDKKITEIFRNHDLHESRMISGSKSGYRKLYPKHDVLFNANIFTPTQGKVWWGDLDITLDNKKLQDVCNELGEEMIVTSEMMGRFGADERPYKEIFKNAHARFTPNSKNYEESVYSGLTTVIIDKMMIVTGKTIDWVKKRVRKK